MKNQNLRKNKLLKKRRLRKDFVKKNSVKKNSPKIVRESRREIYAPTNEYDRKGRLKLDERGAPLVKKIGEKIVKVKRSKFTYAIPKSKKFKQGRKEVH